MDQTEIIERERRALQLSLFDTPVKPSGDDRPSFGIADSKDDTPSLEVLLSGPRPWTVRELEAWAPPDSTLVSGWAVKHRVLSPNSSAFIGEWQHRGYYGVEIMDAFLDPVVEEITLMAAAQAMKTDLTYNMLGYAADQDPAPAIVAMPSIKALGKANERIKDMIKESPALQKQLTGLEDDLSASKIKLKRMSIHFVTAGSTVDTRNLPARYIFEDEVDDYPESSGKGTQGSPMGQLEARATSYWNRKIVKSCTPTLEGGNINTELGKSDKRWYWVPCPHCMGYQILSFWQIKHVGCELGKWPKDKRDKDYIISKSVARYQCLHCKEEIDERHKSWMDSMGTWIPECGVSEHSEQCSECLQLRLKPKEITSTRCVRILRDGTVSIPRPRARHRGYRWGAEISPFRSWSEMAAKYFEVKEDPEDYKVFVNLWLGEVWQEATVKREEEEILALRTKRPALICPPGTVALTAGADNQKHGKWAVIKAWIRDGRSIVGHTIRHGFVESFEELEQWSFEDVYALENSDIVLPVWRGGIDIGGNEGDDFSDETMTEEVYEWLRAKGRGVWFGVKGSSRSIGGGKKMRSSIIDRMPSRKGKQGRPILGGLKLWLLDTSLIKNAIWSRIESKKFHLHADIDSTYAKHMIAEQKEKTAQGKTIWTVKGHRANHLFDAEVYAAAMADPECDGGVMVLRSPVANDRTEADGEYKKRTNQPSRERTRLW